MKNDFNRRSFLKAIALSSLAPAVITGNVFAAESKSKKAMRVVIVGGGYGGSTAAKYMKLLKPDAEVTMIDRNPSHTSCAVSNEYIFGISPLSKIQHDHAKLVKNYGVKFIQAEVTGLDAKKKAVKTSVGDISYDKLIVSPGIGYDYDEKAGFNEAMRKAIPAAWIAGPETILLKKQLDALKKGGTVLIRTPKVLYRCPPGPYERASLMANFVKKLGGKVVVIDPNPGIVSKAPLFKAGFEELYKDTLEYIPNVNVKSYDAAKKTIVTDKGNFTADVINFIPDQKAADVAFKMGLVKNGEKWASVSPKTFESEIVKDVYVIGDAIFSQPITTMPKSGVIANGMAKFVVDNIKRESEGKEPLTPILGNSCYSLISPEEGIWIASVYEYNPTTNKIDIRNGANAIPDKRSVENKHNLESWVENIFSDTFM